MKSVVNGILLCILLNKFCIAQGFVQNTLPPLFYEYHDVELFNENKAIVIGDYGKNYITTNGGISWSEMIPGVEHSLIDLHFLNDQFGLIISARKYGYINPPIFRTTDGGLSWSELPNHPGTNSFFETVFILDSLSYFIAGWEPSEWASQGCLFYTYDGGNTWERVSQFGDYDYLREVEFINDSTGIAVNSVGGIYRSTDKGLNWTLKYDAGIRFRSLSFCDSQNGFAIGGIFGDRQAFATTDGGLTWQSTGVPPEFINSTQYCSFTNLLAAGSNYSIYRSTDQGSTWQQLLRVGGGSSPGLNGISSFDINHIIAVGTDGKIFYSSDSGITWGINLPVELTSFTAVERAGTVLLTWITASEMNNHRFEIERLLISDNEQSEWALIGYKLGKGTTTERNEYTFIDKNISSGHYLYRLKQVNYDGSYEYTDAVEVMVNVPQRFSLDQNYPNPFNPVTEIKYSIPEDGFVSMKIFNALGQEAAEPIDGMVKAGSHVVTFDASGLSSGVYYYRISSGRNVMVKKMLLIK